MSKVKAERIIDLHKSLSTSEELDVGKAEVMKFKAGTPQAGGVVRIISKNPSGTFQVKYGKTLMSDVPASDLEPYA